MRRSIWALALATLGGCGYSTGLRLAPGYSTIGIEVFGNDSPERDLEREFHAALTRATRDLVDAELVSPERASLVMRGKVLAYYFRGGIRTADNVQVEAGLTISVEATLWDPLRDEPVAGPVVALTPVGFTLDDASNEEEARSRLVANIAERLVLDLLTRRPSESPETAAGPAGGGGAPWSETPTP